MMTQFIAIYMSIDLSGLKNDELQTAIRAQQFPFVPINKLCSGLQNTNGDIIAFTISYFTCFFV